MKEDLTNRKIRLNVRLNEWMKHEILGSNATETNEDETDFKSRAGACDSDQKAD